MSLRYKAIMNGEKELLAVLGDFPNRAIRAVRGAQKRTGQAIERKASSNTGRSRFQRPHLADQYTTVQRVYRSSGRVVTVVGVKAGTKLAHIYEGGTAPRYTNYHSPKVNVMVQKRRQRRVRTPQGFRTIWETVKVKSQKTLSSRWRGTALPNYRGIMPAFHPLKRAVEQTDIVSTYEHELRAGLERIASRYSAAG